MVGGARSRLLPIIDEEPAIPIIAADYLADFRCIGPRCEDSCCSGWSCVSVDQESYEKYKSVTDPEIAPLLRDKVGYENAEAEGSRLCVKLNPDTTCPFHTGEKLCKIQERLGEAYLPTTCQMYPRISKFVGGVLERSAVFSCPEIVRLALLRPEGIAFTVQEVPPWRFSSIGGCYGDTEAGETDPLAPHALAVRNFAIELLQDRSLPLSRRLSLLAEVSLTLKTASDAGSASLVERYLAAFRSGYRGARAAALPEKFRCFEAQCELLLEFLADPLYVGRGTDRFKQCRTEMAAGLRLESGRTAPVSRYRKAYYRYYRPFMESRQYIFENYLANCVFRSVFPARSFITVFDAYAALVLSYAMIRVQLVAIAAYHKTLNEELVVKVVQAFSKSFEHRTAATPEAIRHLRAKNRLSIEYLTLLFSPEDTMGE